MEPISLFVIVLKLIHTITQYYDMNN